MNAVYRRELRASLLGMTGPVFIAYVLLFIGINTVSYVVQGLTPHFEYVILSSSFLSLLAVPVLTMRSLPEERHNKTDQLLFSLPITTGEIIVGKYLAMVTVFAIPTAVCCLYPLVMLSFVSAGSLNFITIYGTILCYFLLGCAVIAVCMFLSAFTESQVISAILSIGALLLIYSIAGVATFIPDGAMISLVMCIIASALIGYVVWLIVKNTVVGSAVGGALAVASVVVYLVKSELFAGLAGDVIAKLALFTSINSFAYGVFDIAAILYYISVAILFVFLTVQAVEKRRWS